MYFVKTNPVLPIRDGKSCLCSLGAVITCSLDSPRWKHREVPASSLLPPTSQPLSPHPRPHRQNHTDCDTVTSLGSQASLNYYELALSLHTSSISFLGGGGWLYNINCIKSSCLGAIYVTQSSWTSPWHVQTQRWQHCHQHALLSEHFSCH